VNCSDSIRANGQACIRPTKLAPAAAFYLLASMTVSFLAGSSAPTPLYPLYQTEWGFSPVTVTVVFGIYALALLCALLLGVAASVDHGAHQTTGCAGPASDCQPCARWRHGSI
jgi:hypothetical protein